MKSSPILVFIFFSLFSFAANADLADARDAMARGDLEAAAREYARLAEAGDATAQAHLGYMYYTGEGVEQDHTKAVQWYRKAAEQGNADARYNLAVAYAFGEGVEQDYQMAADWYRQAAEQGHAAAQYSLGLSYTYGEGVEQDYDTALRWFGMAADQNYAAAGEALNSLEQYLAASDPEAEQEPAAGRNTPETPESSILDMEGIEPTLPRDQQQPGEALLATQMPPERSDNAPMQDQEAVAADEEDAALQTDAGDDTAVQISSAGEEDDTTDSAAATATAAAAGNAATSENDKKKSFLERLFGSEEKDEEPAETESPAAGSTQTVEEPPPQETAETETAMPAAETETPEPASDTEAEEGSFLGRLFGDADEPDTAGETETGDTGTDEPRSFDPALYEQGMNALDNGDYGNAVSTLRESASQGDPRAQYRLGTLFYQGLGVSQSYSGAMRWYRRAAEAGNADAQYSLGNMHFMGEGVEQDDARAGYWYEKAAKQGHVSARHNLSNLKRVMERAGEPHKVMEGEEEDPGPEEATGKNEQKRGLFDRLFGDDDKTAVNESRADPAGNSQKTAATQPGDMEKEKPSVLHKDGGGLFGGLFGNDDEDAQAAVDDPDTPQPEDGQSAAGSNTATSKSDSVLHKDSGGLFGYLFGGDDEESQEDAGRTTPNEQSENMTPAQTETNTSTQKKTAVPDSAIEDYNKGMAHAFGDGAIKDQKEAFTYFRRSAEAGYAPAQYQLGVAYAYARGIEQDKQQASDWYKRAATQGHAIAQRNLGLMYLEGEGVEEDKIRALAWYSILAESGNAMDIHRRDNLVRELSPDQITESHYLRSTLQKEIETAAR